MSPVPSHRAPYWRSYAEPTGPNSRHPPDEPRGPGDRPAAARVIEPRRRG